MRPILTSKQVRQCDSAAIAGGIPSVRLMENAAHGAFDALSKEVDSIRNAKVLVICGKGNNGGDGMALARFVKTAGGKAVIALAHSVRELGDDAQHQLRRAVRAGIRVVRECNESIVTDESWDIIVDALLGTGAELPLSDLYRALVAAANRTGAFRFALDLPTGLMADGGRDHVSVFSANATATFGAIKPGMLFHEGRLDCGRVTVVDIGIPGEVLDSIQATQFLLSQDDIVERFPARLPEAHKYSVGKVLLVCGSQGMMGAAMLASRAAMRSGAGMTVLCVPQSLSNIAATALTETIIVPLAESADAAPQDPELKKLLPQLQSCKALVIGCGVSKNELTAGMIRSVIAAATCPVVLDADGLAAFTKFKKELHDSTAPLILTPHVAELANLMELDKAHMMAYPVMAAHTAAVMFQAIVVLKGGPTVVATPAGVIYVNPTGNPGMATAGAGDVLAGMIGAFLAQGCSPLDAALCGVYIHGRAGDLAASVLTEPALVAGDIINYIPDSFRSLPVRSVSERYHLPQ